MEGLTYHHVDINQGGPRNEYQIRRCGIIKSWKNTSAKPIQLTAKTNKFTLAPSLLCYLLRYRVGEGRDFYRYKK